MRRLALVVSALSMVVAASVVIPLSALAATSTPSIAVPGANWGARTSKLHLPLRPAGVQSISTSVTPAICDAAFHFVGSPNGPGNNILYATAAISANDIWAVGISGGAGGFNQALAEHWNGAGWTIVPTPQPSAFNVALNGVAAIASNNVWAVGDYWVDNAGSTVNTFAEHWNGATWTLDLTTPNPNPFFSLLFGAAADPSGNVWAVGDYDSAGLFPLIEKFNGTSWSQLASPAPSPSDNELFSVSAFSSTDAWAVGEVSGVGGMSTPLQSFAQHWDGTSWTLIATPNLGAGADNEILGVSALEAGHAVGVGYGNHVAGPTLPLPRQGEAWDLLASGTSTSVLESGPGTGDSVLEGVDRSGAGVWAVGYSSNTVSSAPQSLVIPATWDGTSHTLAWSAVGTSDSPSALANVLFGVSAVSPYAFWAAGADVSGAGVVQTLTESYCARHFSLSAHASAAGGVPFSLTVTVQNGDGTTATAYGGTVHFTSSDGSSTLPANYMFVPGDNGAHTFSGVVLRTAGTQTITVADIAMPLTVPATATVDVCIGVCQAPAGTAGSRNTNPSSSGTPGARTGANQSGAGTPGTRLPRLGLSSQSNNSASSTGPATTTGQATNVVAAAPAAASTSAQPAPSAGGAVGSGPSSTSVETPALDLVSLVAQKAATRPPDQTPSKALLFIPLFVFAAVLLVVRSRRAKTRGHAGVAQYRWLTFG